MEKTGWDKSSRWYSKVVGESGHYYHQHVILPSVLALLGLHPGDSVLDLGCGQGVLGRSVPPGVEYLGVDVSSEMIGMARRMDSRLNHTYKLADVSAKLDLSHSYDHVVMILSLQNMDGIETVFENISRATTAGGDVILVLNHPCFRIPRQSGWLVDETDKQQKRWLNRYMSPLKIPISTHPSDRMSSNTWSFHYPLSKYVALLSKRGFFITTLDELVSDKESRGRMRRAENRSRAEIPLFLVIKAAKRAEP